MSRLKPDVCTSIRSERMTPVAAGVLTHVELGAHALRLGSLRDETDVDWMVHVVTAPEYFRPLLHRHEELVQVRYRAVVRIAALREPLDRTLLLRANE